MEIPVKNGTRLTSLAVSVNKAALVNGGGLYREDDPIVQEWLKIMEANRKKLDEEEGIER